MVFRLTLLMAALLVIAGPVAAANSSRYTPFDVKACKRLSPAAAEGDGDFSGVFECPGLPGFPVTFAEGDLRSMVAFGRNGQNHCAFRQTFSGFNSVGDRVEWRLSKGKPVATIFRWRVSYDPEDSTKTKTWLVVSKLENGNSCHMAYVEGSLPDANAKARAIADGKAPGFACNSATATFVAAPGTTTAGIVSALTCEN